MEKNKTFDLTYPTGPLTADWENLAADQLWHGLYNHILTGIFYESSETAARSAARKIATTFV
jgi:ribonucleotide reductase alpha subunit